MIGGVSNLPAVQLAAHDLTSGYGDLEAIRNVDLEVRAGEVVSLMGPNGAGKTTLLSALAGELPPLRGAVEWKGTTKSMSLHAKARSGLAYVPQGRSVINQLDVAANLKLSRGGLDAALDVFPELKPLLRRRAGLLSGGEQQMVAMGRALSSSPRVLLIDELSLGLSPAATTRLMVAVRDARDRGVAVLLVEQQVARAMDVCDRWVVLRRGSIAAQGNRSDSIESIESAFVGDA